MIKIELTGEYDVDATTDCILELVEDCESDNIFIEGDNIDALKLLQEDYKNKIKMIYIDPPYNTGKTKKQSMYPDKFTHEEWLSMMYPRLKLARELLRDDGVIFISIDDREQHHLRMLCDRIFGEGNFVANIIWHKKYAPQNDAKWFSADHDFILCYARNKEEWRPNQLPRSEKAIALYKNPDNDPRGLWQSGDLSVKTYAASCDYPITTPSGRIVSPPKHGCWRVTQSKLQELIQDNRIWFGSNGDATPRIKRFLSEVKDGITPQTIWPYTEVGHNQDAKREILELFEGDGNYPAFDTPKPTKLMERLLTTATDKDSLVLDFFSGSSTTAHAVMQLNAKDGGNRKFIMVQIPEKCKEDSKAFKAGYKTIADIGKERIRRAAKKIKEECLAKGKEPPQDLGFKVLKCNQSNFKPHPQTQDPKTLLDLLEDYALNNLHDHATAESLLYEILLAKGWSLTAFEKRQVAEKDVYVVCEGSIFICMDRHISKELIDAIIALGATAPKSVIMLDIAFNGDDSLKNYAHSQFKNMKIEWEIY